MKHLKTYSFSLFLSLEVMLTGCRGFLRIDPPADQVVTNVVYSNDETATSAIRGIYAQMLNAVSFSSGSRNSITLLAGRSADEFINVGILDNEIQFSNNNILPQNLLIRGSLWQDPYKIIYACNAIIENLDRSGNTVSESVKRQLKGEAYFIRAFCHFYLSNMFREVPIVLTTDYQINLLIAPSSQDEVYKQVITDLKLAEQYLGETYVTSERVRSNKYVAKAMLARVYLYAKDWVNAEAEASAVISKSDLYSLITDDLNKVFLKNSRESILQFSNSISSNVNTREGSTFIYTAAPSVIDPVALSKGLLDAFEQGDLRFQKWVGTILIGTSSWSFPYKYKIKTGNSPMNEYSMVLRLAEQYLIRGEARIQQNKISAGIEDLNVLRNRSRALPTTLIPDPLPALLVTLTKEAALAAVERERRIELFSEWGHRWFDLKRTDRADAVLAGVKGVNWQSTDIWYPIPISEFALSKQLKQNPGY